MPPASCRLRRQGVLGAAEPVRLHAASPRTATPSRWPHEVAGRGREEGRRCDGAGHGCSSPGTSDHRREDAMKSAFGVESRSLARFWWVVTVLVAVTVLGA